jgi:chorismate mutase/prephenate dehydratase
MRINHFGKPYSFSHVAALRRFGKRHEYISRPTIVGTIDSIVKDYDSIGIVPIENTTGGIIHDTVNTLCMEEYRKLLIREELELPVRLFLLAKSPIALSHVRAIYSHEYALKRSEGWIKQHTPQAIVKRVSSTSDAACKALEEKYSCAISSSEASSYYGLKKIEEILVEGKKNLTRFFVLGNVGGKYSPKGQGSVNIYYGTTIIFELEDRVGALCDALQAFKKNKITLTRIISRPDIKKEWGYVFFIEIKGGEKDQNVKKALIELDKHITDIRILGSYPLKRLAH